MDKTTAASKPQKSKLDTKNLSIIFLAILGAVILILLAVFSGPGTSPSPETKTYFSECKILADSCLTEECRYYFLCSGEAGISDCKIYDCNTDYGVLVNKNGQISTSKRAKPNPEQTQKMVEDCRGEIEILTKECKDNSLSIALKVKTAGQCKIISFLAKLGDGSYVQPIWTEKDGIFELKVENNCGTTEIVAIGAGGVAVKKSLE